MGAAGTVTLRRLALVTLLIPILGAGCSSAPVDPAGSVASAGLAAPRLLRGADLRLPLDDYVLSPAELGEIAQASRTLVGRCMAGFGLDPLPPPPPGPALRTWNDWRYGLTDPEAAAQHGYRHDAPQPATPPEPARPTAEQAAALTGSGTRTIRGRPVPDGGCLGQADMALRGPGSAHVDRDLAQRLSAESFRQSRDQPQVRAAIAGWSQCMARRGYRYPDPFAPVADPRFRPGVPPPSATEIATAVADVDCKRQSDLVGIWFAAERSYQQLSVADHRAELDRLRQANAAQLAAARALR
ncbi:hypothetical protein [Actinocrispum sp. NPDC049592]|uniref:hypothetical protein n=1 Tax=Actinocrispum sp. NPDC049592 TaxID=3154835 RepID=UPI00341B3D4F